MVDDENNNNLAKPQPYVNNRCKNCGNWDYDNHCCGDKETFWAECCRDGDYEDIENGSIYYNFYDKRDEENSYYLNLHKKYSK